MFWTAIAIGLFFIAFILYLVHRADKNREIDLTQDILQENVRYDTSAFSGTFFYRVKYVMWQGDGFVLLKTKKGKFALTKHDKVMLVTANKTKMFSQLAEEIGPQEALTIVRRLKWKVRLREE